MARARTPRRTPEKARLDWLTAFEKTGTVTHACREADVPRRTVYDWRHKHEDFALAWADIEEATTEAMEREAFRRAVEGVVEPLYQGGKHMTDVRKYSDTLLIFMLKSRRPEKYRDNVKIEHTGTVRQQIEVPVDATERSRRAAQLLAEVQALPDDDA